MTLKKVTLRSVDKLVEEKSIHKLVINQRCNSYGKYLSTNSLNLLFNIGQKT